MFIDKQYGTAPKVNARATEGRILPRVRWTNLTMAARGITTACGFPLNIGLAKA